MKFYFMFAFCVGSTVTFLMVLFSALMLESGERAWDVNNFRIKHNR